MLVAAEELLRLGGADALTVESVIERAGTSTGSFYARFGNRRGLFVAMHERFLETLQATWRQTATDALAQSTLRDSLRLFFGVVFAEVRRHRDTLHFHMIHNAHDLEMRGQGNEFSRGAYAMLVEVVRTHSPRTADVNVDKIDLVGRTLFGLLLEIVLFDSDEVNGRNVSDERLAESFTDMVLAYL